jgi:DNA polymerase-1
MELYRKRDAAQIEESRQNGEQVQQTDEFDSMKAAQLKALCKEYGLKVSGKKAELQERLRGHFLSMNQNNQMSDKDDFEAMDEVELKEVLATRGLATTGNRKTLLERIRTDVAFALELMSASTDGSTDGYKSITQALEDAAANDGGTLQEILSDLKAKSMEEPKWVDVTITSLGMTPTKFTAGGAPSCTADVLRGLAGDPFADPPKYGSAHEFFGGGKEGHDACVALYSLTAIGSIDTMIANFLTSLQALADHDSRVHGSINLNTETGRLSSRRPNLQNQPALEKDKYQIRRAFQSSPGNNLIVADYGQLELRLLASMTDCTSMIEAFEAGGDFHSRTALGMFDYIQKAVEDGEVLLEWDYANGDPPKPMLKDEYASERRKAKTLNFSIAYGKTAHGLSQDWGVSIKEAEDMLQAWYDSRPEVLKWQEKTKATARKEGITRTLMGRYRQLPDATGKNQKLIGHSLRASINTPIQGGAADVAMMAMIKINDSKKLKKLGWILLMQIHDEVILEGPEETAEEAFEEVLQCMQEPWKLGLEKTSVPLLVDGSYCHNNWYDAK